ncbi:Hpt domain-containing protein [Desulfosporosinus sp. FKB]|uniref:Hpt domain-containing protein n=1 Tax=Desulfosporosinus sp. FKB TaxID=1969835 RepID=UPI000B4A2A15|nr:Hpt domain-containing protein [Desulfosporosinus sp. FKB]
MNPSCRYDLKGFSDELGLPLKDTADLFSEFITEIKNELSQAENVLTNNNLEELQRINHNIKGISANFKILDLYEQTCKISKVLKSSCDNLSLQSLLNNLFIIYENAVQEITAFFAYQGIDIKQ